MTVGTPTEGGERQFIQAYGNGGFRVSGTAFEGSVLILPGRTVAWTATSVNDLTLDDLSDVLDAADEIEILLVGGGLSLVPVSDALRQSLREAGIVVDTMDTGAACRTYSVLSGEDRRVAAALIAVD